MSSAADTRSIHVGVALIPGFLLLGLAVARAAQLEWSEYARLFVFLVALGWMWRARQFSFHPVVLSAALMVVAFELCSSPTGSKTVCFVYWGVLTAALAAVTLAAGSFQGRGLVLLDGVAIAVGLAVFGLSATVGYLLGLGWLWKDNLQWLLLPVLWILLARWTAGVVASQRWIRIGLWGVLLLICSVGCARATVLAYYLLAGGRAEKAADYRAARDYYGKGAEYSATLGLAGLHQRSTAGLARSLQGLGEPEKAAAVLGLDAGRPRVIQRDEWAGPTGGLLFKNVSCWKDLWLPRGKASIRVHARGSAARGVWPRMQVHLGGRLLGEVEVASKKSQAYEFSTDVEPGRQRLEITFLNDFWELGGEDRSLFVGRAEIGHEEVGW